MSRRQRRREKQRPGVGGVGRCTQKEAHYSVTTIAKVQKQPNCPTQGGWARKPGHSDTVQCPPPAFSMIDLEIHVASLR